MTVGDPLRNRWPRMAERELGARWLIRFRALMQPGQVVAVGQTARRVLPVGTTVVRHPANGGAPQLRLDLAELLASIHDGWHREG